jgi:hypothetical protein
MFYQNEMENLKKTLKHVFFQGNGLNQQIIRKSKKDWYLNPAGKSTICILHEYLQHSMKQAPVYNFSEVESAATPYW